MFSAAYFSSAFDTEEGVNVEQFVAWIHSQSSNVGAGSTDLASVDVTAGETKQQRRVEQGQLGGGGERILGALLRLKFDRQLRNERMRRCFDKGGGYGVNSAGKINTGTTSADSFSGLNEC
jgi:hypothetical protein